MNTHADVVVYSANPGGITAAVAGARRGLRVVLLESDAHVGGLPTSGLNNNEQHHMFPLETFGGLTREFTRNLAAHFPHHWPRWPGWYNSRFFEDELLALLAHPNITLLYNKTLAAVAKSGTRITSITLTDGTILTASVFIDASYEGDLLAKAGVAHRIGREARSALEPLAGVTWTDPIHPVDPYDADGLLPGLSPEPMPADGAASPQVQNINYRITLTSREGNKVPIPQPKRYDPRQHELLARALQIGAMKELSKILGLYPLPNEKFECNNNQAAVISLSMRAVATQWITASPEERAQILHDVREYNLGLMHFLRSDPRVPTHIQQHMLSLGLPADDYADTGHWPYEIYVREGRRMESTCILTQQDVAGSDNDRRKPDTIALGSHFIDCHWVDRYPVGRDGFRNEGRLWQKGRIFEIPYRSIVPRAEECTNLLVPGCVSATHVAFCCIRLEPTWMTLGESAVIAASLAIDHDIAVQEVDIPALQNQLLAAGQIIHLTDAFAAL